MAGTRTRPRVWDRWTRVRAGPGLGLEFGIGGPELGLVPGLGLEFGIGGPELRLGSGLGLEFGIGRSELG